MMNYVKTSLFLFLCTPVYPIFEHDRAVYKAQKGNYEKALPLLEKAVTNHPDDPAVLYDAGVAAYKTKDSDQAYAYFSTVTQLAHVPQSLQEQAHYNRAVIHTDRKEYDKAIEQCDRILQINPEHQKAKELKKVLVYKKQQQQQDSKDHSKKSDKQGDEQNDQKNSQKDRDDKKEQQQNKPQQAEDKNEQSDMSQEMEHTKHQDKKQNTRAQESSASKSENKIAEKIEKNTSSLDCMLERVLEEQEKASQASLKKMLKTASQEKRVGHDDRNSW